MNKTPNFWNVATDGNKAEIELYGDVWSQDPPKWYLDDVGDFDYIAPNAFRKDLDKVRDAEEITIRINSCGGDVYTGLAIHNELKQLTGHKTVIIEGIAASAASFIAMAGDEVQMYPGSMMMIHGVAGLLWDFYTVADLKKVIKGFEASEKAIANIYAEKTGKDVDTLRNMMSRETWMVGKEAVENGFADTLLEEDGPALVASADRKVLLVAGVRHDVTGFHLPENVRTDKRIHSTRKKADENKTTNSVENKQEEKHMTLAELKEQSPELVAEIETSAVNTALESAKAGLAKEMKDATDEAVNAAVVAERARLQKIDEIAHNINDAELVDSAKYGESPMTAEELAFEALKKQQNQGTAFLADMTADTKDSNVNEVTGTQNAGVEEDDQQKTEQAYVNTIVNAYVEAFKEGKTNG